jgi:hypothetical protein
MDGRGHVGVVVPEEDGDAVGCLHADKDISEVGAEGIYAIEGKHLLEGILADERLVDDAGRRAVHLMVGHEEAWDRDGNTAISRGGEGGDRRGSGVDVHVVFYGVIASYRSYRAYRK